MYLYIFPFKPAKIINSMRSGNGIGLSKFHKGYPPGQGPLQPAVGDPAWAGGWAG